MGFVQRAFTPGGGEAPEAIAQRASAQAKIDADAAAKAAAKLIPPSAPAPPQGAQLFQAGSAPARAQRASMTATTMLGAAAAGGQTARKSLLGQ